MNKPEFEAMADEYLEVRAERDALKAKLATAEAALGVFKDLFTKWLAQERESVDAAIAAAKVQP